MSRSIGDCGSPDEGAAGPAVPGSPDEALALAVRISRLERVAPDGFTLPGITPPGFANFEEAFRELAAREGGRLRDPRIVGGDGAFEDLACDAPRLSPDEARDLYLQTCWVPTLCDHLPRPVALEVFDMAALSGAEAALRALKTALHLPVGKLPDSELVLAIRQADPARLRARFFIARLADIAGRLNGP